MLPVLSLIRGWRSKPAAELGCPILVLKLHMLRTPRKSSLALKPGAGAADTPIQTLRLMSNLKGHIRDEQAA